MSYDGPKLNILVAYPYMTQGIVRLVQENASHTRFLLDSGAFTAHSLGKEIKLDDYCRFIERLPFKPWRYFTLDAIGDPETTLRNYETMLRRGFKPVPVLTQGESFSVMDDYWKTSDVVGVGGLVHVPLNVKKKFIQDVMRHANGRRVHWLGFTNDQYVKHYRPYMCDSSAWTGAGRFGNVKIYVGGGRCADFHKSDFARRPPTEVLQKIRSWGIDPYALAKLYNWHGGDSVSRKVSGASYVEKSCDYERHLGVKLFLACATQFESGILFDAIKRKVKAHVQRL